MQADVFRAWVGTAARAVEEQRDHLTQLDAAIGDADHGGNLARGFAAVLTALETATPATPGAVLTLTGSTLISKVGGASGPLYGTLFMTLGKALPPEPSLGDLIAAFDQAIAAVRARGKSDVGQKTMLDVFCPVLGVLRAGGDDLPGRLKVTAKLAAEKTIPMRAIRGRASFLGERSIGHMDPGARSSALIVDAVADVMEGFG